MTFLWNKYTLILLHIITTNLASENVDHLRRERADPRAKVLTSFLQVPWINLNGPWTNEVTSHCADDIAILYESADAGEIWALQMLDAASKIPSGILTGNIYDLGMYDECVGVKGDQNPANIEGRYCLVSLAMPSKFVSNATTILSIQKLSIRNPNAGVDLSLTLSVCLPSSCGVEDIVGLVNASIQSTPQLAVFGIKVVQVSCSMIESGNNFTSGSILAISFFAVIIILLLLCTTCDFVARARPNDASVALRTIAKFSLYTNAMRLLNTETTPGIMPSIYGIRALSMCVCLAGHRVFSWLPRPTVNISDVYAAKQTWLVVLPFTLPYVVDTFFVISGFLASYWFLTKSRSGEKMNVLTRCLHRYIRLTPSLAVSLIFSIFILPHLGSGPVWKIFLEYSEDFCRKNWWTNLLYVQNYINPYEMCLPHTWYVAIDMQLFCLCPIVLYPLLHRPKLGLVLLGALLLLALIAPAIELVVNQRSAFWNLDKSYPEIYHEFTSSYMTTHNRALPYLMGILLGYDVANNKRRITTMRAAVNWILACIFVLLSVYAICFIQPIAQVYNVVGEAFYVSAGRFAWSIAMAWVLYACTQGYGGPATRFLSHPVFVPLSRLSYSIYLVHFVMQMGITATERVAAFFSPFSVIHMFWGDLAMSTVAAFVLTLCVDFPVAVLEEMLRTKESSKVM